MKRKVFNSHARLANQLSQSNVLKGSATLFDLAYQSFLSNQFSQALHHLQTLLKSDSNHFDAWHLLGVVQFKLNLHEDALKSLDKAQVIKPNDQGLKANCGMLLLKMGQEKRAIEIFSELIEDNFQLISSLLNRAQAHQNLASHDLSLADVLRACHLEPLNEDLRFHLALAYFHASKLEDARAQLVSLRNQNYASSKVNTLLGRIAIEEKRFQDAIDQFELVLATNSKHFEALLGVGVALLMSHQFELAVRYFDQCITLDPHAQSALFNRALAYKGLALLTQAQRDLQQVLRFNTDHHAAKLSLALIFKELQLNDQAKFLLNEILERDDLNLEANLALAQLLKDELKTDCSRLIYSKLEQQYPNNRFIQWSKIFLDLPAVFDNEVEIQNSRENLARNFQQLQLDWSSQFDRLAQDAIQIVGSHQPYHLAYQCAENKHLLSLYGSICSGLMAAWSRNLDLGKKARLPSSKIKIGIVSDQIRYHSVWNAITKGFVVNLDKNEFELHIYSLSNLVDAETQIAMNMATAFHQRCGDLLDWMRRISEDQLDYLIYPEIGMHALTTQLASMRLAKQQMVFWGHPETTGIPTIDYFISAELFEQPGSDQYYSERLIKLPDLGTNYTPLHTEAQPFDLLSQLNHPGKPILICPGNLYKYLPEHDWIWIEIAKRVGECNMIFFCKNEHWKALMKQRLERLMDGKEAHWSKRFVFLSWINPGQFKSALNQADLFLDTIGFSGFNTAIQAIESGLPLVTMRGRFLRGSFASAMLSKIGMTDLIAKDENEYIHKVETVLKDQAWIKELSNDFRENFKCLCHDLKPVRALEVFMKSNLTLEN